MKKAALWVALGTLFLIPFLPLYVANDMFFPFITSKGFWFRILVEIAAGAWVVLALADRKFRPKWSWTLVIYAALVAWMFVANLFAVNPHKAFWSNYERMDGWVTLAHVFLFFIVSGTLLSTLKLWKRWWLVALGASVLIAGYSFLQLAGALEIHQGGVRTDASFGNAAYLAAYLLFMITAAVWHGIESKGWLRYGLFILAALHTVILFTTATRGAILGFVGAAALSAFLYMVMAGKQGRKVGASVLAIVIVLSGLFLLVRESTFVQQDPTLSRVASITLESGSTRFTLWKMAFEGFLERPVVGWGQEGYAYIFNKYYEPSLYAQEAWFDRAHSVYIDWLVAGGAPGFVLFVALLLVSAIALLRSSASRAERVLLVAALSAYAFQALFVFDNLFTYVFLAALLANAHEATARPIQKLEEARELPASSLHTVALPMIAVVTAVVIWMVNVPGMSGNLELIRAVNSRDPQAALGHFRLALSSGTFGKQEVREQLLSYAGAIANQADVPIALREEIVVLALTEAKKQIDAVPEDARMRVQYAQTLEAAGDLAGAVEEVETALSYSPSKQGILYQLGIGKWKQGDRAAAREAFLEAYKLDRTNPLAAQYAAAGEFLAGNAPAGEAILLERFMTTTVDSDILRFAYYETKQFDKLIDSALIRYQSMPHERGAVFLYVQSLTLAGRAREARAALEAATHTHPEWSEAAAQLSRELGI
jgi:O-antigen ligase